MNHAFNGNFIKGTFKKPLESVTELKIISPGDTRDTIGALLFSAAVIEESVKAAMTALETWKITPALERVQFYTNKLISLQRTTTSSVNTISNGKVNYQNGQYQQLVYMV